MSFNKYSNEIILTYFQLLSREIRLKTFLKKLKTSLMHTLGQMFGYQTKITLFEMSILKNSEFYDKIVMHTYILLHRCSSSSQNGLLFTSVYFVSYQWRIYYLFFWRGRWNM